MRLWPRLPLPRARVIAGALPLTLDALEEIDTWSQTDSRLFAPTGGIPLDESSIRKLRKDLMQIARVAGYPGRSQKSHRRFDSEILRYLADASIPFGEAIRSEVWAWTAVVLVPHLVQWRWGTGEGRAKPERFAGPLVRNCFGRLWYQAMMLDRGHRRPDRWAYVDCIGADQAVALLERPSLAANREICQAVGHYWSGLSPQARREEVFRDAMKRLIVRAGIQRLDLLKHDELGTAIADSFVPMNN